MKKIILMMFLGILGTLKIQAQTGIVKKYFYMENSKEKLDTCLVVFNFEKGMVTELQMNYNHEGKDTYVLASFEGEPNMWHNYKTVEARINDFKIMLDSLQQKFRPWSKTAIENKVRNFSKSFGKHKNVPILLLSYFKNGVQYFQESKAPCIQGCLPIFGVDSNGICRIFFSWKNIDFERTKGYSQGFLTSYPIKEEITLRNMFFQFSSPTQLQSLIDVLDIEKAKKELLNKTASNKDVDSLFK